MLILLFYFYIPSAFSYKVYPFSFVQNIMCFFASSLIVNYWISASFFSFSFFDQLSFSCETELKLLLSFLLVCVIRRNDNKKNVHKLINLISDSELKKYNKSSLKLLKREKWKGNSNFWGFHKTFLCQFFSSKWFLRVLH